MSAIDQNQNRCNQQSHAMLSHFDKILVIGLGELGLPVAKYVKEKGFDTYGYDINIKAIDRAKKTAEIKLAVDFGSEDFDVFLISVSTHQPNDIFSPQINGLLCIADKISKEAKKDGALVSIESTIPKGTSKKVFDKLNHKLHVVHAPHRWYSLEEKEHGVNQLRVIGGVRECYLKAGMQFYGGVDNVRVDGQGYSSYSSLKSLGVPMHPVSNIEVAEITKIAENAHRYLQIAFAEELYLYCQANNIKFPELRDALNTKWNVEILEPREGIGGHCLPKDTKMFLQSTSRRKSSIIRAAMEVDEDYKRYRAKLEPHLESPSIEHNIK
jgi:nucleotide sugar dehydrogenase